MKKTKFLTCLAALTLLLASCEVTAKDLDSDTTDTESSDTTTSDTGTGGDTGEGGDTGDTGTGEGGDTGTGGDGSGDGGDGGDTGETTDTYTYSVEVTNADALKELTYDGNAASQTGVDLAINLVTTSSTGDVTTNTASESDVTLAPASEGVVTVSGLTVTPVAAGNTTLTVTWTEGNVSTTADVSVTDVTVSTPEPTPVEPTTWTEYLEANADGDHIDYKTTIDAFLDGDLDEIVPYVASEIGYQYILVYEAEGRVSFKVSDNDSGPATNAASAWKTAITDFGYTDLGDSTYQNDAGYKVEFNDWSFIGDFTVYVYPIEQVQEGPTTWEEFINNDYDWNALTTLLGASLDDVLPFYYEETGYSNRYVTTERFDLYYYYPADGFTARWAEQLEAFGYTEVDPSDAYSRTFKKDGYTVDLTDYVSLFGMWDLYLYPPVDTGDEGNDDNEDLETAQAILDAAAAQTNGYAGFDNLHIDAKCPETNLANYRATATGDLTIDENNCLYGKFQWSLSDENGPRIRYYYNDNTKYYYDNMSTNGNHNYTAAAQSNGTGERTINGLISTRLNNIGISSSNYDRAFANASSIDLSSATELALDTETNGNYKLTFIYNDIWYCYKADANLNLLGAGYSSDWTSSTSFEIVYGEETTRAAIDEIMETDFFSVETWFPKQASDDEIAQAILDAADDCDYNGLDWDAFHGEYIDESMDETDTLYLTTDSDGLYGSGICLDDGDPSFEYYYKNGKEYVHNSYYSLYSVNDSDFYYGDSYDDIIDDFTSDALGDAFLLDLDDDEWTLTTLSNGYELIIETAGMVSYHTANVEYVYITDLDYNLLAVAYGYTVSLNFEGWYAEQATNEQVEASLADFDPANWGEGDGGDEATSSWADYLTDDDYAKATELLGKTLDEVLPVVLPEGLGYQQISVASSSISFDASDWFTYDGNYPYDYNALNSAWAEALIAAGYTTNDEGVTYTDGTYKVTIEYVDYSTIMGYGITWTLTLSLA